MSGTLLRAGSVNGRGGSSPGSGDANGHGHNGADGAHSPQAQADGNSRKPHTPTTLTAPDGTTAAAAAVLGEAEERALEVALAAIDRRCRYTLPLPPVVAAGGVAAFEAAAAAFDAAAASPSRASFADAASPAARAARAAAADAAAEAAVFARARRVPAFLASLASADASAAATERVAAEAAGHVSSLLRATDGVRHDSDALAASAAALMVRRSTQEALHTRLAARLATFSAVERLAKEAAHPLLAPHGPRFAAMLEETDAAMARLAGECGGFLSARAYAAKLSAAQHRAMALLRDSVVAGFAAAADALTAAGPSLAARSEVDETVALGAEAARRNAAFVAALPPSHTAGVRTMEARCGSAETDVYFADAVAAYASARARLLTPLVAEYVHAVSAAAQRAARDPATASAHAALALATTGGVAAPLDADAAARLAPPGADAAASGSGSDGDERAGFLVLCALAGPALAQLSALAAEEAAVAEAVWTRDDAAPGCVAGIVGDVGDGLVYEAFRRRLLLVDSMPPLCALCSALGQFCAAANNASPDAAAFGGGSGGGSGARFVAPLAQRLLADVRERLIFRGCVFASQRLQGYAPSRAAVLPHVAAPATLAALAAAAAAAAGAQSEAAGASEGDGAGLSLRPTLPLLAPVGDALALVAALRGAVDAATFAVFASEAVALTVAAVARAQRAVSEQLFAADFIGSKAPAHGENKGHAQQTSAEASAAAAALSLEYGPPALRARPTLHAALLGLRQLLHLRERLARHDAALRPFEERSVDLDVLFKQRRVAVRADTREARRDVEDALRDACEAAIAALAEFAAAAVDAAVAAAPGAAAAAEGGVAAVAEAAAEAALRGCDALVSWYVEADATRAVLARPVAAHAATRVAAVAARAAQAAGTATAADAGSAPPTSGEAAHNEAGAAAGPAA